MIFNLIFFYYRCLVSKLILSKFICRNASIKQFSIPHFSLQLMVSSVLKQWGFVWFFSCQTFWPFISGCLNIPTTAVKSLTVTGYLESWIDSIFFFYAWSIRYFASQNWFQPAGRLITAVTEKCCWRSNQQCTKPNQTKRIGKIRLVFAYKKLSSIHLLFLYC